MSLSAIHTPKVLVQSGVGDERELQRHGITVEQHLPGVGRNLQDQKNVVRNSMIPYRHQTGTAKRGRASMSIGDGDLMVIGELAAESILQAQSLQATVSAKIGVMPKVPVHA